MEIKIQHPKLEEGQGGGGGEVLSPFKILNLEFINCFGFRASNFVLIALTLSFALQTSALTLSSPNDLILSISPSSPRAGASFTVTAKSFSFDTARANFRWFLNGKEVASGRGVVDQTFTAGKLGSQMEIRLAATSADGNFYETSAGIAIADIDFIINPLTYAPNFYRGAALPTPGSIVEIIALPHLYSVGARLNPQSLIYEWSLDDKPVLNQSGGGKNKLALKLADVGSSEYVVTVKVSSLSGGASTQKNARLKTYAPEILFYETSALTGTKPKAIALFLGRAGSSFSILAEPFFFDLDSLKRAVFTWKANGEKIAIPSDGVRNQKLLELTAPPDTESQTNFSLRVEDKEAIFQQAEATLQVTATP